MLSGWSESPRFQLEQRGCRSNFKKHPSKHFDLREEITGKKVTEMTADAQALIRMYQAGILSYLFWVYDNFTVFGSFKFPAK